MGGLGLLGVHLLSTCCLDEPAQVRFRLPVIVKETVLFLKRVSKLGVAKPSQSFRRKGLYERGVGV